MEIKILIIIGEYTIIFKKGQALKLFKVFLLILPSFSLFFYFFHAKNVKKHFLASVWSVQHPNTGLKIQQSAKPFELLAPTQESSLLLKVSMNLHKVILNLAK